MPVSSMSNRTVACVVVRLAMFDTQHYLSLFREFDGVANKVDKDLAQSSRIATQPCGDVGGDFAS
jgi:hypothetical protein